MNGPGFIAKEREPNSPMASSKLHQATEGAGAKNAYVVLRGAVGCWVYGFLLQIWMLTRLGFQIFV